ncbi:MAG: lipopolysaccharide biosynthesis protein [Eubacterium sp.]
MSEVKQADIRNKKALKSGVWYTISSITVKAILIITTPIFTRLMSTEDYGLSATFTTWFTLLNVVCSLNVWYSIGRAKIDFPGKLDEFVGSIQLLAFFFTAIIELIACAFLSEVSEILELPVSMVIALFVYLLIYPAVQLTQQKFKYVYNYKGNIAIAIYTTVATVIFSLCFVLLLPEQKALGKSLGAVVAAFILGAVFWINTIRKKNIKINTNYWKYALVISVPLILNSISLNILMQSDRIFITKYCGSGDTGIYSLAYSYAILITVVLNSINQAWLPWFHDTFNDKLYDSIKRKVKPLIIFGCWFGTGCIAIAPEAIMILGGPAYKNGIWVVPPIALGIVCNYIFEHYEHIELHLKKTWYISLGTIIASIINIVLNIIFIQRFGYIAAAYTTLFCYFLLMILHHFISMNILKVHLYDNKFMYLALFVMLILATIFMLLYNALWVWRWLLIIVISLVYLYFNKQYIMEIVYKFRKSK